MKRRGKSALVMGLGIAFRVSTTSTMLVGFFAPAAGAHAVALSAPSAAEGALHDSPSQAPRTVASPTGDAFAHTIAL